MKSSIPVDMMSRKVKESKQPISSSTECSCHHQVLNWSVHAEELLSSQGNVSKLKDAAINEDEVIRDVGEGDVRNAKEDDEVDDVVGNAEVKGLNATPLKNVAIGLIMQLVCLFT